MTYDGYYASVTKGVGSMSTSTYIDYENFIHKINDISGISSRDVKHIMQCLGYITKYRFVNVDSIKDEDDPRYITIKIPYDERNPSEEAVALTQKLTGSLYSEKDASYVMVHMLVYIRAHFSQYDQLPEYAKAITDAFIKINKQYDRRCDGRSIKEIYSTVLPSMLAGIMEVKFNPDAN